MLYTVLTARVEVQFLSCQLMAIQHLKYHAKYLVRVGTYAQLGDLGREQYSY